MEIVKYFYGDRKPIITQCFRTHPYAEAEFTFCEQPPVVTVCGIYDESTGKLNIGIARCSEKDNFVKKVGKELAYNRAVNNPYITVQLPVGSKFSNLFYDIAKNLVKTKTF